MNDLKTRNQRVMTGIVAVVIAMIALSFASVPLYRIFCEVTGIDGTVTRADKAPTEVDARQIDVLFDARVDSGLPWDFRPEKRKMTVHIGQQGLIAFKGDNLSAKTTIGTAVYNVTPAKVAKYFHKTQCFCFAEQLLNAGETAHFPVVFFIDPAILKDREMDDVTDITLSYTFFAANSAALDRAISHYGQKP